MAQRYFTTCIYPSPGSLTHDTVREVFRLVFEDYGWFLPERYGHARSNRLLDPHHIDYDALVACYEETQDITVLARTDRDFILLYTPRPDAPRVASRLTWCTSVTASRSTEWQQAHLHQIVELMCLLNASLAQAGWDEDIERKTQRLVPAPDGVGSILTSTVRVPGEGLAGLFWRNVFGPPFTRLFGERLLSLPPETHQALGGGLVLVQPYERPSQAMTPEGDAAEARLITVLGPECFYDFQRHQKPTRVPELTPALE